VAWYDENSGSKTHAVGQKQANQLEIYDMSGNVWEWCSDWYGAYSSAAAVNPLGASSGEYRVVRGGSWYRDPQYSRVASRGYGDPGDRSNRLGFRLVLVPVR
jgi:formylglycine-generating enzyme required for sulfatase activity